MADKPNGGAESLSDDALSASRRPMDRFFGTRYALWLALPVGAAVSLAFAPFDWWPLAILCPAFLLLAWEQAPPRRAAKFGFLFTAGTYLAGTYWLYHSIYEIGNAPIWLTLVAMLGLVAIMGAYTALVGYAVVRWIRVQGAVRWLLVLPAAIVILEWFRGWFLSGFPWLALGSTQTETPLAGLAPVGGIYLVSLAVMICAGAVATLVLGDRRARTAAICTIAAIWAMGFILSGREWTQPIREPVTVAIVQGAVPQEMKWDREQFEATLDLYRDLTTPHLGAQIIVWPESALAAPQYMLRDFLGRQWAQARQAGSTLVLGQLRHVDGGVGADGDVYHNSILALDDDAQWYAKRRLVPLSEYFPVPEFMRNWLKGMDLPYSGFEAGENGQPALDAGGEKLGATICYEDAYASEQLDVLKEATLLVNVTNDAWFGDSTAAHQHLQISRMRALEAGRPLLRAANDGISAIIGAEGEVKQTLPRFQPGVLAGEVQPHTGLTPYARVGNYPVISVCSLLLLAGLWPAAVRRLRRQPESAEASAAR